MPQSGASAPDSAQSAGDRQHSLNAKAEDEALQCTGGSSTGLILCPLVVKPVCKTRQVPRGVTARYQVNSPATIHWLRKDS